MTLDARFQLRKDVMAAEGCQCKPYRDSVGVLTIGYGRNLDDVGISKLEAEVLLDHDLADAERACRQSFDWFDALSNTRQRVLVEMCFNLGMPRLRGFGKMLAAIKAKDFPMAAREMLASRWALQVKGRADRLAAAMRDGTA